MLSGVFSHIGPLYYFNKEANATAIEHTGTFFLESDLYIEENVRLDVIGSDYGGDVSRLLLVRTWQSYLVKS